MSMMTYSGMLFSRKKLVFLILIMVSACGVIFITYEDFKTRPSLSSTFSCNMQDLNPWDRSFPQALRANTILKCSQETPLFQVNESGYLVYDQKERKHMKSLTNISCFYATITRRNTSDSHLEIGNKTLFEPPIFINSRIFVVTCMNETNKPWYQKVYYNVAYNESNRREELESESVDTPSIIVLGFDSLSRSHAIRSLPKTMSYLSSVLGFYDFKGYTKCAENTFPNLLGMAAGVDWREFFGSPKMTEFMDDLPLFWKGRKHVSLHCEDTPYMSTFNYLSKGFQNPPADYYCRPLFVAYDRLKPFANGNKLVSPHCYGNQLTYEIQVSYLKSFIAKYKTLRKTAFIWHSGLLHDSMLLAENSDIHVFNLLRWLHDDGHLDNSILIIISDHGFRMGGGGMLPVERTNPVFLMHFPKSIKDKYPWIHSSLQHNTDKLVSPHDVYATLMDIMHGKLTERSGPPVSGEKLQPRSLFQRIPQDRTCEDAGIPFMFCIRCFDAVYLDTKNNQMAQELANFSIAYINTILNLTANCSKLSLKGISKDIQIRPSQSAVTVPSPFNLVSKQNPQASNSQIHAIVYRTSPNNGVFEHLLMYSKDVRNNRSTIESMGSPVRMSAYGHQADCVDDDVALKPFCFCLK